MSQYPTKKEPIGRGEVFWSDGGKQIRIFGETTTLRGPTEVLERVAMRILHLADGHGGDAESCISCPRLREIRLAMKASKMTKWVIFGSEDRTEMGLASRDGYDAQPALRVDTDGCPMRVYEEFEARTYEEAKARYRRFMGG